jgi:hypothetical protein
VDHAFIDNRHVNKVNLCNEQNINLMMIWEHEWRHKKDIIKSMITNKIGLSKRIFATECSEQPR